MISPLTFTEFKSEDEKLEYYKRYGFLAKSKTEISTLLYSGSYTDSPCETEIIGYTDCNTCVISIYQALHTITVDYLKQMQTAAKISAFSLQELERLCCDSLSENRILLSHLNIRNNYNKNNDLICYEFNIDKELLLKWYLKDNYFYFKKSIVSKYPLNELFYTYTITHGIANDYVSCYYTNINDDIKSFLFNIVTDTINSFPFYNGFGCCSKYEECSDAKTCLHNDLLYAKGCIYRQNLENGYIFYGNNRTNNDYNKDYFPILHNQNLTKVNKYIVLDIETTGFYQRDEIIELSALKIEDDEIVDTFSSLIHPNHSIPIFITELTGINNEMVENAPAIETALPQFLEFIKDFDLIGHNIDGFDIQFINKFCQILSLPCIDNNTIDTLKLAKQLLPLEHHKLENLVEYFNIKNNNAHRALSDCYATLECYKKLINM